MSTARTAAARLLVAATLTLGLAGATTSVAHALPTSGTGGTVVGPIGPGDHPEVGDFDDYAVEECPDDVCVIVDPIPEPGDEDPPTVDPGSSVDPALVAHPTFTG